MTYFGVNMFFGGMHSYGHSSLPAGLIAGMCAATAALAVLCLAATRRYKRFENGKEQRQ